MLIAESILLTIATAATPLLLAAIGELVVERSGVLNLGVEGMMVMGAVCGFGAAAMTGSPWIGMMAAILAGVLFSLLFGFLTLTIATNQVATGLSLTLLGLGLSSMIGEAFVGSPGVKLPTLANGIAEIPLVGQPVAGLFNWLAGIPLIGRVLFEQDPIFYISIALVIGVTCFLFHTRAGLVLRSVGDNHASAHALGTNVIGIRYLAVMFGGACAGLAGGHLSLVYTPQWVENMSAGRGWIALALVVFASWRPLRLLAGAYLFGAVSIGQLHAQALGLGIPSQLLSSLPYLATVLVLVLISRNRRLTMMNTPASLGQPFVPDR
ncbi:ABC transporter permease [Tianweitania sp. BSSL-BM11]|uniref:ABC transporter permease n=1 Tax=Tianweitania aestuarii TaxID=2814886 RepID=A0ABS5RTY0_9HYPH|nr:ABC transporter permease [Tianweitania aestuarii]MBS9720518.1 ABC transporter permease [Tianweitania aestuarii]